ncbi:MAG: hypothetical protein ACKN9W_03390 [Methylococcus sp.]
MIKTSKQGEFIGDFDYAVLFPAYFNRIRTFIWHHSRNGSHAQLESGSGQNLLMPASSLGDGRLPGSMGLDFAEPGRNERSSQRGFGRADGKSCKHSL